MRHGRALKKAKKRKETQRCDKSHICPDHPRCATPTNVVMWGGVSEIVIHAKFHKNRFRGFGSPRDRNLPFSCLVPWLIWQVRANLWLIDWLIEQGLTSHQWHQTHYRSYRGKFWPNQQCQSTAESQLVFQIRLQLHQDHSTMLQ